EFVGGAHRGTLVQPWISTVEGEQLQAACRTRTTVRDRRGERASALPWAGPLAARRLRSSCRHRRELAGPAVPAPDRAEIAHVCSRQWRRSSRCRLARAPAPIAPLPAAE